MIDTCPPPPPALSSFSLPPSPTENLIAESFTQPQILLLTLQVYTAAWTLLALYAIAAACHALRLSWTASKSSDRLIICQQEIHDLQHQISGLEEQLRSSQGSCQSLQQQLQQALSSLRHLQVCCYVTTAQFPLRKCCPWITCAAAVPCLHCVQTILTVECIHQQDS